MADLFLRVVACAGALLHLGFVWMETGGWSTAFVAWAAPNWLTGLSEQEAQDRVGWAAKLAKNVAGYNFALALGLAWVALAGPRVADSLGVFVAIWLLIAAGAAALTGVRRAAVAQGAVGVLLLAATLMV